MSVPVRCFTNLDVNEEWPTELPCRPVVGDYVYSRKAYRGKDGHLLRLRLVVVSCSFGDGRSDDSSRLRVELHLPSHFGSIVDFEEWYWRFTGGNY